MARGARQGGQAMTELTLAASAFLVPMFLVIPMIGKMIDMKHTAIQTARYEAWEYTVWYSDLGDASSGFSSAPRPEKAFSAVQRESRWRWYSDEDRPLAAGDRAAAFDAGRTKVLWSDLRGDGLLSTNAALDSSSRSQKGTEPAVLLEPLDRVVGWILDALGSVLGFLGSPATFDALNLRGQFTASVDVPVANVARLGPFDPSHSSYAGPYVMSAKAAVLSDGWNAGGKDHAQRQASGLVVTSLLNNGPIRTIQDVMAFLIAPEVASDSLIFGYTDSDGVHPDRLEGGGSHSCPKGFCRVD